MLWWRWRARHSDWRVRTEGRRPRRRVPRRLGMRACGLGTRCQAWGKGTPPEKWPLGPGRPPGGGETAN
eukprot:12865550-Prorocentrum_lima.AAC.1